ncbi:MAG: response regulator transcription factor [Proteobacteria bacterium]|nr:response regulator transcription factor [Pseudomonadota bacterium]MDE3208268.1 response regulator transcription factor [Pseudomonadota bacterium]
MIDILIADDHTLFREGLKQIIHDEQDMQVAGEAVDGQDVLRQLRDRFWDVLILDMSMPGKNGIALIQQIKASHPDLPVLVLSMHHENQFAIQAIRAGASGYITKNSATGQLIDAIRKVHAKGLSMSPAIAEKLALQLRHPSHDLPHANLSSREFQIFHMLVEGQKLSAIAATLSLSVKTVSTHKVNILHKMEMASTAGLVHYAIRHHLFDEQILTPAEDE